MRKPESISETGSIKYFGGFYMAEYNIQGNVKKQPEQANQMSVMEHNVQGNVKKQPLPESAHQVNRMQNIEHSNVKKQPSPEMTDQMNRMPVPSMTGYRQQERIQQPEPFRQQERIQQPELFRQQERIQQPDLYRQPMQPTSIFQPPMPQPMQTMPSFQAGTTPRTSIMTSGVGVRESVLTGTDFTQGFLLTQIGRYVKVEFLLGTNMFVDREGTLIKVGTDYIIIQEPETDDYLLCDIYSIKFIRFYY